MVKKDLKRIDNVSKSRIKRTIETRLMIDPEKHGPPLKGNLKGFRKLRIGEYRIIYKIVNNEISVLGIMHRKEIYKTIEKRKY